MSIDFLVENKVFSMPDNFSQLSQYIIKSTPHPYQVTIKNENNILDEIQKKLDENPKNLLFADKKVYNLYLKNLKIDKKRILLATANENFKTLSNGFLRLISFLEKNEFTKSETLITVGGGVIEDVAAFAGACYKRGIKWIFYPTTLLSMCDSCIGGKTGINHHKVKNQLALFSAPAEVIINIEFLKTLSDFDIRSGMGEILKLLVTGGKEALDIYIKNVKEGKVIDFYCYKPLILSSLSVKRAIVEEDEFELYHRKSLNYGHTLGHAIEVLSNYKIPHGQAVIIGMVIVNKLASNKGILNNEDYKLTQRLSKELLGNSIIKKVNLKGLDKLLQKDKKTQGNIVNFVVIEKLGNTKFLKTEINSALLDEVEKIIKQEF